MQKLKEKNPEAFFVSGTKNIGLKEIKIKLIIEGKRRGNPEPKIGPCRRPTPTRSCSG
jgi:hypothetical protein